ncbi:MAG: hypothetical protein ABJC89_00620 [Acidobacteriota bacterium]
MTARRAGRQSHIRDRRVQMLKSFRTLTIASVLTAALLFGGGTAQAQDCQPGLVPAFTAHGAQYTFLLNTLIPGLGAINNGVIGLTDQASYATLLAAANSVADSIPTGRIVLALPDGTVVLDTSRPDNVPADPKSNTYQHFLDKTINENHNSRVAFLSAQLYPCGFALESKLSTTTGQTESYIALRLGNHLDNRGTVRISSNQ